MRPLRTAAALLLAGVTAQAQPPVPIQQLPPEIAGTTFDVASIKRNCSRIVFSRAS